MTISTPAVVVAFVISSPLVGAGAWIGWKRWNKRMHQEMMDELNKINKKGDPEPGQMRKFLLGSEKFGFFWRSAEAQVRFFLRRPDGTEVTCNFPVSALKTTAVNTLLIAVFVAAQLPPPPEAKLDQWAQEVQKTIVEQPPVT